MILAYEQTTVGCGRRITTCDCPSSLPVPWIHVQDLNAQLDQAESEIASGKLKIGEMEEKLASMREELTEVRRWC